MVSGCRIDKKEDGSIDLVYFGNFSQSIESQTLNIRSDNDLADIIGHLEDYYVENVEK